MEIAVLGGGMVGSLIATELSKDYNITVIDNESLNIGKVKSKIMDVIRTTHKRWTVLLESVCPNYLLQTIFLGQKYS